MENTMMAFMPIRTKTTGALVSLAHMTAMEQIAEKTCIIYLDDGSQFEVPYSLTELAKIADESFTDFIRNSMKATKAVLEENEEE
jgi:hypothetical protein